LNVNFRKLFFLFENNSVFVKQSIFAISGFNIKVLHTYVQCTLYSVHLIFSLAAHTILIFDAFST